MKQAFKAILKTSPYRQLIIFTIPSLLLLTLLIIGFVLEGSQQFTDLAQSFLHGHLYFLKPIGGAGQDPVFWNGKIYWSEGPFPAILLMPFVAIFDLFRLTFYQGYIKWLLVLGVQFFVYKLARHLSYSQEDSLILSFGFTLGSVFIGVASVSASWFFAQVVTTFLLFWSLYEYNSNKRWWLIGIMCALIFMTRPTAAPIVLFFGLELWRTIHAMSKKIRPAVQLVAPMLIAIILLGLYNFLRFHNPFDGGYANQVLFPSSIESESYGVFSLIHVPTNLYSALLRGPVPVLRTRYSWSLKFPFIANNVYGMSIFVTSPYLVYVCMQKWRLFDAQCRNLLCAMLVSAAAILSYFGVGLVQFGYRYSLDFLPELFLLFMILYRKNNRSLSRGMKAVLIGAGIFNFYLLWPLIL